MSGRKKVEETEGGKSPSLLLVAKATFRSSQRPWILSRCASSQLKGSFVITPLLHHLHFLSIEVEDTLPPPLCFKLSLIRSHADLSICSYFASFLPSIFRKKRKIMQVRTVGC
ncbi:hypothetical protein Ancab_013025 [Ancistrocladus abbreviatus]